MFRPLKKRSNPTVTRVRLSDVENDEVDESSKIDLNGVLQSTATIRNLKSKQRKGFKMSTYKGQKKLSIRSFDNPDSAEDDAQVRRKKTRRTSLGYGGMKVKINEMDDRIEEESEKISYDKESLTMMMKEHQSSYVNPSLQVNSDMDVIKEQDTAVGIDTEYSENFASDSKSFSPPVSLESDATYKRLSDTETILTGEEALSHLTHCSTSYDGFRNDDGFEALQGSSQDNEDTDAWEAEVVRRAGVVPTLTEPRVTGANFTIPIFPSMDGTNANSATCTLSVNPLKEKARDSLVLLQDQLAELASRNERRGIEIDTMEKNIKRYEKKMKNAGAALEFYQQWRSKLCAWVGALRDLQVMVDPILRAFHDLEGEKAAVKRWRQWEDDIVSVLRDYGMVEEVIGRQPPINASPVSQVIVDEYGRDLKPRHVMQREKRRKHRHRIHEQRKGRVNSSTILNDNTKSPTVDISKSRFVCGDVSDAFISDGEEEVFRGRHRALQEALRVALDQLQQEYTLLQSLVDLFDKWKRTYPEEYKQSYASLSLADMASVLVKAELCSLNDPWNESHGYNEAKWTSVMLSALEAGTIDCQGIERLFQKSVLPVITGIFEKESINLVSSRHTKAFSTFFNHSKKLLRDESPILEEIQNLLKDYVEKALNGIAIPMIRSQAVFQNATNDEVLEAHHVGTWGQMSRIKRMLCNVLHEWAPILQKDPSNIEFLLHFLSNKYLFLLSSLKGHRQNPLAESPADAFGATYQALCQTGWLDYPEFMLHAAPIRAAAAAYGLDCNNLFHEKVHVENVVATQ